MRLENTTHHGNSCRTGAIHLLLIACIALLFVILLGILGYLRLWTIRIETQRTVDAASRVALQTFVSDDLLRANLTGDRSAMEARIRTSRENATRFIQENPVDGRPLTDLPGRLRKRELLFGFLSDPRSDTFRQWNPNDSDSESNLLPNTVRLTITTNNGFSGFGIDKATGLGRIRTRSSSTLDCNVIGFRHLVSGPLPIMPIALLSDFESKDRQSWEYRMNPRGLDRLTSDLFRFSEEDNRLVLAPRGDGLPEFVAFLRIDRSGNIVSNMVFADIGVSNRVARLGEPLRTERVRFLRQFLTGVTKSDLERFGAEFVFDDQDRIIAPIFESNEAEVRSTLPQLHAAADLLRHRGIVRVWPLRTEVRNGQIRITGFVAARIAAVEGTDNSIRIRLQPTMLLTASAVTDSEREASDGRSFRNPYICKLRTVE